MYAKKAEVNKNMTVHQLRHTFASRILKIGVDINVVSQWLGHENISTAYDIYIHATKSQENVAVQLLCRL
ncbi:tyrosine-type recombinase/integrase [Eubacterium maltosivorans]|uniref:tyrosine-type recombinase/integrase n=1 Tax=Eubacterium maltosivorans TaxID=2041044 RepID=UPI00244EF2F0|nr:tyrosine-type recombinase/integrase [Eubacterium maltosivorans]